MPRRRSPRTHRRSRRRPASHDVLGSRWLWLAAAVCRGDFAGRHVAAAGFRRVRIPLAGAEGVLPTGTNHVPAAQRLCQYAAGHRNAQPAGDGPCRRLVVGRAGGKTVIAAFTPLCAWRSSPPAGDSIRPAPAWSRRWSISPFLGSPDVIFVGRARWSRGRRRATCFWPLYAVLLAGRTIAQGKPDAAVMHPTALPSWRAILPAGPWPRNIRPRCSCCSRWPSGPLSDDRGRHKGSRAQGRGIRMEAAARPWREPDSGAARQPELRTVVPEPL